LLPAVHDHPPPDIDTRLSPEGRVSVTVTAEVVAPAELALLTVTEYVAPLCPWMKLPVCEDATVRTGSPVCVMVKLLAPIVRNRDLDLPVVVGPTVRFVLPLPVPELAETARTKG
jgi:hypothetical protein